jgi:hypothetical protein
MVRLVSSLTLCVVLALPGLAAAQDGEGAGSRLILGPNSGNLGLGSEAGIRLGDHFGLRVGTNYLSLETAGDDQDPEFNFNVTPPAAGAMLDYYPFRGGFRLTGGLRYNPDTPDLIDGPSSAITIGGLPFTPSAGPSVGVGPDYVGYAPYGGLGLQSSFWEGRLELVFDLGVYYRDPNSEAEDAKGAAGPEAEANSEGTEEELRLLGLYPIIGLSATYRF